MPRTAKLKTQPASPTPINPEDVNRTLAVLGGKWTIQIIARLLGGTKRFGVLMGELGKVSPKMGVSRLRELEEQGLVTRTLYPEIPPRVEYALTDAGRSLAPVIEAIRQWGDRHGQTLGLTQTTHAAD